MTATAEQSDHKKELAQHAGQLLNVMGKFGVTENFVPRMSMDLSTLKHLEFEETNAGTWVRVKGREVGS